MNYLAQKNIIVGISGGIAAYKAAEFVRLLKKAGAEVRVIMTTGAQAFITPLTLQALSGHRVHDNLLDPEAEAGMGHIELARWADAIVIAPATANTIAALASGQADQLLTAVCLATTSPIAIAPAMNQQMWEHPSVQDHLKVLTSRVQQWGPASGEQACGEVGLGRLLEPAELFEKTNQLFASELLAGKHVVITAGPTQEAIDPVRYISNHSSGKMGYALATAAREAGARVTLISGPTALTAPANLTMISVISALDMQTAVESVITDCDIFIGCAAVADYRPTHIHDQKMKKNAETLTLELTRNPDIISLVAARPNKPFVVGFAAETENLLENARGKLIQKKLDLIIANRIGQPESGFMSDFNTVTLITKTLEIPLPPQRKSFLAPVLLQHIATILKDNNHDKND